MGYTVVNNRKVYESEEDRLRDAYPTAYHDGWMANSLGGLVAHNPYTGDEAKAFNVGWNDKTLDSDKEKEDPERWDGMS